MKSMKIYNRHFKIYENNIWCQNGGGFGCYKLPSVAINCLRLVQYQKPQPYKKVARDSLAVNAKTYCRSIKTFNSIPM